MVLRHARPHLEIHSRSKGHSAVAGVAYRLGLRLWDERLQVWHDYRRRALGEEVVMALTVAPDGAPEWATDPGQLWNAVELAEKRKDSQVARDYRIPVPLGLNDKRAGQLAERLARFIMGELGTPVSVGLHRDADTDALGEVKPPEKQGYHAHLYFPSRPLVLQPATGEGGKGGDGSDEERTAAFGARHPMLASKALGRGMVETFNRVWAELATAAAADAGMDARYDHRSYERMGVDLTPQPTLGSGATALERKGFWTRKGDAVRDIVVVSQAYELAHHEAIAAQHEIAKAGVEKERSAPNVPLLYASSELSCLGASLVGDDQAIDPQEITNAVHDVSASDAGQVIGALSPGAALVERFEALAPRPLVEDREKWIAVLRLVRAIQRALGVIRGLGERLAEAFRSSNSAGAAEVLARVDLDRARHERDAALRKQDTWAMNHAHRLRFSRWIGRETVAWRNLSGDVAFHQKVVQKTKEVIESHRKSAVFAKKQMSLLQSRKEVAQQRLLKMTRAFSAYSVDLFPALLAAMTYWEREELAPIVEVVSRNKEGHAPIAEPRLIYSSPTRQLRP